MANIQLVLAVVLAWFLAQLIKVIIDVIEKREITPTLILSSGGMPSSHSAFVTALATAVYFEHGLSVLFWVVAAFALIVMHDSMTVRRMVGEQAVALNTLFNAVKKVKYNKLNTMMGHTLLQVIVGAVLGILVGFVVYLF